MQALRQGNLRHSVNKTHDLINVGPLWLMTEMNKAIKRVPRNGKNQGLS